MVSVKTQQHSDSLRVVSELDVDVELDQERSLGMFKCGQSRYR